MATMETEVVRLAQRVAVQFNAVKAIHGDITTLTTTDKTSLVAAVNELQAAMQGGVGAAVNAALQALKDSILGGASGAFDTLKELEDAVNAGGGMAAITDALRKCVRVDIAQTFDDTQKAQARANIGAYGAPEIGDPSRDLVAVFEGALV